MDFHPLEMLHHAEEELRQRLQEMDETGNEHSDPFYDRFPHARLG